MIRECFKDTKAQTTKLQERCRNVRARCKSIAIGVTALGYSRNPEYSRYEMTRL